jgi:hypothetical protein
MNEQSIYQLIDEKELSTAEEITLTTQLIRILEKDIDDKKSANTREGWSTWAILGGIVGAALLLFGQTKEIQQIPPETAKIGAVFLLLFFFLSAGYNVLSGSPQLVKAGRLISAEEVFKGQKLLIILKLFLYSIISFTIFLSDFNFWTKLFAIILILLPIFLVSFSILAANYAKIPIGNNPQKPEIASRFAYLTLSFYFMAVVLLGAQLPFPVGQTLSSAYVIGISLSIIIALFEVLLSTAHTPREVPVLEDLKDEIIFRRVGLNEALNRYKILKEGKTLFEEMKPDLDKFLSNMYQQEEIYNDQIAIVKKFRELLPTQNDTEDMMELKQKDAEMLNRSAQISREKLISLNHAIQVEIPTFNNKLIKVASATGDFETKKIIDDLRNRRFQDLIGKEKELDSLNAELENFIKSEQARLKQSEPHASN